MFLPLERAQEAEQRGDLAGGVLVDGVQAHEGIKHEEFGPQGSNRGAERLAVLAAIEAQHRCRNDVDVEGREVDAGGIGDALEPLTHDRGGVLGGIEEHGPSLPGREVAQAGDACGNGDGKVESEEGFAAFGLAADDADGLAHPQSLDEPGLLGSLGFGEQRGAEGGKRLHGADLALRRLRTRCSARSWASLRR